MNDGSWRPLSPGVRRSTLSPSLRSTGVSSSPLRVPSSPLRVPSSPLRLSAPPRQSPSVRRHLSRWTESQSPIHTLGGAGRPISQRWRDWQQDWRATDVDPDSYLLRERRGDAYRWGLRANNRVYRYSGPSSMQIDGAIRSAFARFDANDSGRLDYRELRNALWGLGLDATQREAAEVLASYDTDGSGLMEIDEFAQLALRLGWVPGGAASDYSHSARGRQLSYPTAARRGVLAGELQVWVSSSASTWIASQRDDHPAGGAYVVLELGGCRAQSVLHPPMADGATGEGNFFSIPVDAACADNGCLELDTVAWWPGQGERSLGSVQVPLPDVCECGRLELRTPLDAYVELVWRAAADWNARAFDASWEQGGVRPPLTDNSLPWWDPRDSEARWLSGSGCQPSYQLSWGDSSVAGDGYRHEYSYW